MEQEKKPVTPQEENSSSDEAMPNRETPTVEDGGGMAAGIQVEKSSEVDSGDDVEVPPLGDEQPGNQQRTSEDVERQGSQPEEPGSVAPGRRRFALSHVMPFLVSLFLTIVTQQVVVTALSEGSFAYRLFRPPGSAYLSIVPAAIVLLFVWTMVDLFIKVWENRSEQRQIENPTIQSLPDCIRQRTIAVGLDRLKGLKDGVMEKGAIATGFDRILGLVGSIKERYVFRRLYALLDHLQSTGDYQRSHELFRHQLDIDTDNRQSTYTAVKIFIWAMPILGFIGTVLGISIAVGDFSGFLSGELDIDELSVVKQQLSRVASGLSFAFDTTLLGLVAGLIAMFVTTFVQKREETFLTRLDELGLEVIGSCRSESSVQTDVVQQGEITAAIDHFRAEMEQQTQKVSASVEHFKEAVTESIDSLSTQLGTIPSHIEAFAAHVESHEQDLSRTLSDFDETIGELAGGIQQLSSGFNDTAQRMVEEFDRMPALLEESREYLGREAGNVTQNIAANVKQLVAEFTEVTKKLEEDFAVLSRLIEEKDHFSKMKLKELEEFSRLLSQTFTTGTNQFIESSTLLSQKVDSILPTQEITMQAIDSLNAFSQNLKELQATQGKLIPLLQQLGGPMEIKLVPVQQNEPTS